MRILIATVLLVGCSAHTETGAWDLPAPVEDAAPAVAHDAGHDAAVVVAPTPDPDPVDAAPPPAQDSAPPASCVAVSTSHQCDAFVRLQRGYTWHCTGDAVPTAGMGGCEPPSGTGQVGVWCCGHL